MGRYVVDILRLMRPEQWYKNIMVFVPLVAISALFTTSIIPVILAFVGLCLISSSGYIFNDVWDVGADRRHPEKRSRPLAAGTVSIRVAAVLCVVLAALGALLLWSLDGWAAAAGITVLTITCAYTLVLKKEVIVDIVAIGANFVLRAATGAFVLSVGISPWLILCTFFLSLTLSTGKRLSELKLIDAQMTFRSTYSHYTPEISMLFMSVSSSLLLMSFALYSFLHGPQLLMLSLPFAFYAVMRQMSLAVKGSKKARQPHLLLFDKRILIATVFWVGAALTFLYLI